MSIIKGAAFTERGSTSGFWIKRCDCESRAYLSRELSESASEVADRTGKSFK
jgi:hypothetical protein